MTKQAVIGSILFMMWVMMSCGDKGQQAKNDTKTTVKKDTATATSATKNIVFFGNSLTAGYGLEPAESFPSLIQQKVDSLKLPYKVINAGVSGETSAGGNGRISWILKQPLDVFVLELGANDGLRGVPVKETKKNLQSIIDKVKAKYPQAKLVLTGMMVPPNMGQDYANEFRDVFPELAKKNNMAFVPFLLQGVGGIRELNLPDGLHPTAEGQKIVANNVWSVLQPLL